MTTLINTPQGVIAVVDERPHETDHWIYIGFNEPIEVGKPPTIPNWFDKLWDKDNYHKIIASTFGVGKELLVTTPLATNFQGIEEPITIQDYMEYVNIDFTKPYEYTETEHEIIVKL